MSDIIDDIVVDVALMLQEHSNVEVITNGNHIIYLDEIQISQTQFKQIFYPFGENFGLDSKKSGSKDIFPFVSFLSPYRTMNENAFSLLDQIITNLEEDLNISRNCFTTYSLMELTNELTSIKTLYDIPVTSVLSSLTWSNIISVLNDFTMTKDMSYSTFKPLFVVNVVFKSPNTNVKPTMIKFNYRIDSFVL
jgi:hypothetical protein